MLRINFGLTVANECGSILARCSKKKETLANKACIQAQHTRVRCTLYQSSLIIGSVTDKVHFLESNFALPFFGSHG